MNLPDGAVGCHRNFMEYSWVLKELCKIMIHFVLLVKFVDKKLDSFALCTKHHCETGMFILLQEIT